jgi:hypothetical protein
MYMRASLGSVVDVPIAERLDSRLDRELVVHRRRQISTRETARANGGGLRLITHLRGCGGYAGR